MEALQFLERAWPFLLVAAPGAFAVYRQWSTNRRADRRDRGDLIRIAQEAAAAVIKTQQEEIERLRQRIDEVEEELGELRRKHADQLAEKDAKILLLEGELRTSWSQVRAYERLLEANNIPHAKPGQTLWEAREEGIISSSPGVRS